MLAERTQTVKTLKIISDIIIIAVLFAAAYCVRQLVRNEEISIFVISSFVKNYLWLLLIIAFVYIISLRAFGLYETVRIRPLEDVIVDILKVVILGWLVVTGLLFVLKAHGVSRIFLGAFNILIFLCLCLKEYIINLIFMKISRKGMGLRNALVVGDTETVRPIIKHLKENTRFGVVLNGIILTMSSKEEYDIDGVRVLGRIDKIIGIVHRALPDYVIFTIPRKDFQDIEKAVLFCEEEGIEVWIKPDFFEKAVANLEVEEVVGLPMIIFRSSPKSIWGLFFKRLIDIVLSSILLILLLPLFLLAIVGIRLTSPGPVFFTQKRSGLNGKKFTLFKFRSMVTGADQRQVELKRFSQMSGPVFKIANDPRVTPFGRLLRRTSMDELPQLWNVLIGDMSLAGPRPLPVYEMRKIRGWKRRRLSMKPGVTCLWQIRGRSNVDFDKWMEYDLEYIDKWSLRLDAKILFKTVFVVLFGKGAM